MLRAASRLVPPPENSVVLEDVDWKLYSRLVNAFAERPRVRLTYDRGRLEIMAPLLAHDGDSDFFGALVQALAEGFGLPLKLGGSVTIRLRRAQRGLEPDRCFWITSAHRMAGVRHLDLRTHPPPDLAIEVDVTHSSMDRVAIYEKLRVPELWRLDGDQLTFHVLGKDGVYKPVESSKVFPGIKPADLMPYLSEARDAGDVVPIIQRFRRWVRRRRAKK